MNVTAYSPYQPYPGLGPAPEAAGDAAGPPPILVTVADPAPQRRVTVFFRAIMALPQLIVLYGLTLVAGVIAFLGWWGALFTGQLPQLAVTFLSGYVRWATRAGAYLSLLTDVYPPFSMDDEPGYPVRTTVPAPQPLNRAAVFFRCFLLLPASVLLGLVAIGAGPLLAFAAWLVTLCTGQLPASMHQAYTAVLRYQARVNGYWLMLTPAYPGGLHGDAPGTAAWADERLLPLSAAARRLVTWFIVLGVVLLAGYAAAVVALGATAGQSDAVIAKNAAASLRSSYAALTTRLDAWEKASDACAGKVACVTAQDGKAAADFDTFATALTGTQVPGGAIPDQLELGDTALAAAQDFTELNRAPSAARYQSLVSSTGLKATLKKFDTQYWALVNQLGTY